MDQLKNTSDKTQLTRVGFVLTDVILVMVVGLICYRRDDIPGMKLNEWGDWM